MDDYKRTLYMKALTELYQARSNDNIAFICHKLSQAFYSEHSDSCRPLIIDNSSKIVCEFFPEFQTMFDEKHYCSDGTREHAYITGTWWESGWIEPRIRALECILRD